MPARTWMVLASVASAAAALSMTCGYPSIPNPAGGSSTDARAGSDGSTPHDAGGSDATPHDAMIDAPLADNAELGHPCNASGSGCPASDPLCITLGGSSTAYWCTESCGSSSSQSMPPPGGDAICKMQQAHTNATPVCALTTSGSGGSFPFYCALACGTSGGSSYGTCPPNLACVNNACQ